MNSFVAKNKTQLIAVVLSKYSVILVAFLHIIGLIDFEGERGGAYIYVVFFFLPASYLFNLAVFRLIESRIHLLIKGMIILIEIWIAYMILGAVHRI